jgi:hypothetical protein
MILGGKIQDPRGNKSFEEVRASQFDFAPLASGHVILIHVGKAVLKLKGHPLPHDSNAVDRIYPGLRLRFE